MRKKILIELIQIKLTEFGYQSTQFNAENQFFNPKLKVLLQKITLKTKRPMGCVGWVVLWMLLGGILFPTYDPPKSYLLDYSQTEDIPIIFFSKTKISF